MSKQEAPEKFPPATAAPCKECPWRRVATPGHLGPYSAEYWAETAHSESVVACHKTIRDVDDEGRGDWNHPSMRQCRGMAIFRRNVLKTPRRGDVALGPEDHEEVFSSNDEFIRHHERKRMRQIIVEGSTELMVERLERVLEDVRAGNPGHLENLLGSRYEPNAEIEFSPSDPSEDPEGDWSELSVSYREVDLDD